MVDSTHRIQFGIWVLYYMLFLDAFSMILRSSINVESSYGRHKL
jgi:hypothetical protein